MRASKCASKKTGRPSPKRSGRTANDFVAVPKEGGRSLAAIDDRCDFGRGFYTAVGDCLVSDTCSIWVFSRFGSSLCVRRLVLRSGRHVGFGMVDVS